MKLTKQELLRARIFFANHLVELTPEQLLKSDTIPTLEKWKIMLEHTQILHEDGSKLRNVLENRIGEKISNHDYQLWSEMFWVFSGKKVTNT